MSRHLDLLQQYGGTNGYCHLWAYALKELLPQGEIVSLMARDTRTFEAHDWPEGEPLELHRLLKLPDGPLVDAQGAHSQDEMLSKFGIRQGWSFALIPLRGQGHALAELERDRPAWAEAVRLYGQMLASLGWEREVPPYDGQLEREWKRVSKAAREGGIPDPEPLTEAKASI